jgi:Flp pilus assembly protein TadD
LYFWQEFTAHPSRHLSPQTNPIKQLTTNHQKRNASGATVATLLNHCDNTQAIRLFHFDGVTVMRVQMAPKTVRRLLSADGYLDLGMPTQAARELDKITDAGPLEGPRQLLLGIALKQSQNHSLAIQHLEKAARIMPSPIRRFAWKELVEAYRAVGSEELAELAEKLAGEGEYQLKITLPLAEKTVDIAISPKTA